MIPAALGPGIYASLNRNQNQKQKNNVSWGAEHGLCVG
jgi:hypothetical protein